MRSGWTKISVEPIISHHLRFNTGWTKAAYQKVRSEQQESAQPSNKRARIEFASSTASVPQRAPGTGVRPDANNPYLQHHTRTVPSAPPRKSRFGTQYGAGGVEQVKSGRQQWG